MQIWNGGHASVTINANTQLHDVRFRRENKSRPIILKNLYLKQALHTWEERALLKSRHLTGTPSFLRIQKYKKWIHRYYRLTYLSFFCDSRIITFLW